MLKHFHSEKGQGLTEYVIIVGLIAISAIAIVNIFGDTLRVNFSKMASELQDKKARSQFQKIETQKHIRRKGFSDMGR